MSPRRSVDEMLDELCPICEEECSCSGQTELRITKSRNAKRVALAITHPRKRSKLTKQKTKSSIKSAKPSNLSNLSNLSANSSNPPKTTSQPHMMTDGLREVGKKIPTERSSHRRAPVRRHLPEQNCPSISGMMSMHFNSDHFTEWKRRELELDVQYALSEYYFSGGEDESCGDDSEAFAEYYGYSSGSDIPIESLFLGTSSSDGSDDDSAGILDSDDDCDIDGEELIDELQPMLFRTVDKSKTQEESLVEQLAKITPQILAAISMASKNNRPSTATPYIIPTRYFDERREELSSLNAPGLRLDELLDTKKLSVLLSTSPPCQPQSAPRAVPINAFRRSRRNSLQMQIPLIGAIRQNGANCTLAAALCPEEQFLRLNIPAELETQSIGGEGRRRRRTMPILMDADVTIEWAADDESSDVSMEGVLPIDAEFHSWGDSLV
jgi:hypothetical protein